MSDGGESGFRGGKHSAETRQILSELNSGENNAFYGKKHSAETRQKNEDIQQQEGYIRGSAKANATFVFWRASPDVW